MLHWLLDRLARAGYDGFPAAVSAAMEKITWRASVAAMISFALALALGPRMIAWLRSRYREPVVSDSDHIRRLHRHKDATPTMGGLFIVAGLVGGILLLGDLGNAYVQTAIVLVLGMGLLGAVDDLTKLAGGRGISARAKLAGQIAVALVAVAPLAWIHSQTPGGAKLIVPGVGGIAVGAAFVPLAVLVIVGASNAVNLADGLDGLAAGCLIFTTGAMATLTYVAGHVEWAGYLNIPYVSGAGEMTVVAAAMIGSLLGFLWFNCHPAQVFMGDTGSLALGGLLGLLAVVARGELLLLVAGGVFVAEAASVIIQVGYYKWRRRRVFLCAPLHHHFQFLGWPETKIVVRFWIASALCAVAGLAALKLGVREDTSPDRSTATVVRTAAQDDTHP